MNALRYLSFPGKLAGLVSVFQVITFVDSIVGVLVGHFFAPTESCIPAQGETLGTEMPQWMRSEGTPHRG